MRAQPAPAVQDQRPRRVRARAVRAAPAGTYKNGSGAIYGMAESIEDKSLVNEVAWGFLDTLYKATKVAKA